MWNAPDLVPSLTYTDVPRAAEWLERVFGFRERRDARLRWPGGGMTWLEVGDSLFNVSTPDLTWVAGRAGASGRTHHASATGAGSSESSSRHVKPPHCCGLTRRVFFEEDLLYSSDPRDTEGRTPRNDPVEARPDLHATLWVLPVHAARRTASRC